MGQGSRLEYVAQHDYLGSTVSASLKWVQRKVFRIRQVAGQFKALRTL